MRVTFDIQAALGDSKERGIGKYSLEFLEAVSKTREVDISCVGNADKEQFFYSNSLSREKFLGYRLPESSSISPKTLHILQSDSLRRFYTGLDTDIIHISSVYETIPQYMVWGPQLLNGDFSHLSRTLVSATIYDTIPFVYPERYMPSSIVRELNEAAKKVYSKIDLLFAISESAKQDAVKYFHLSPEQVVNISSASGEFYHRLSPDDELLKRMRGKWNPEHKKMIFYTGFGDFRKNHAGLLKSFDALPADLLANTILVFSAFFPEDQKEELLAPCRNLSPSQVLFTGWLTNEELRALYNIADLFVFPSLYEGFGLPVLEAMKCGVPVVLSNSSSLPEVMDLKEAQFDPQNIEQMTERMIQGLTNARYRDKLIQYGLKRQKIFSWEQVAKKAVKAWKNALAEKKRVGLKISFPAVIHGTHDDSFEKTVKKIGSELKLDYVRGYSFRFPEKNKEKSLDLCKEPGIVFLCCGHGHPTKEDIYTHHLLFTQKIIFVESEDIRRKLYAFLPNHGADQVRVLPQKAKKRYEEIVRAVTEFSQSYELLSPAKFAASHKGLLPDFDFSDCLYGSLTYPVRKRLLVDMSSFYKTNNRSGIQRVVRQITEHFLKEHADLEIIPFALTCGGYYPLKYEDESWHRGPSPLVVSKYDMLLMLDSSWDIIGGFEALFNAIHNNLGRIFFMVYDLIPLLIGETCHPAMPLVFEEWFRFALQYADQLICISKAVADQCAEYIEKHDLLREGQILHIDSFILGSDVPIAADEALIRDKVKQDFARPSPLRFLTVGTVEARKNHAAALQVFSVLWREGYDFSWYIFGKHGWRTEKFDELLSCNHHELGSHLFLCDNPTDAEIQYAYKHSDALIFPSLGEGFGLPLVEASCFGLPLLCSDIPVFHEICKEHACYLDISSELAMYNQIKKWIAKGNKQKLKATIWPYTWADSANDLLRVVTTCNPRYVILKKNAKTYLKLYQNKHLFESPVEKLKYVPPSNAAEQFR